MIIREFKGFTPQIDESVFVAETAAVIGDVRIGKDSSVWYSAVIRADGNPIEIGERVSVQDCCCIHISSDGQSVSPAYKSDLPLVPAKPGAVRIGDDVVIGHNATVHACTVGDRCLIGMGSTVLDGAVIGNGSIIGAGALVLSGTVIGPNELWAGVPAKFIKSLTPEAVSSMIDGLSSEYVELGREYKSSKTL